MRPYLGNDNCAARATRLGQHVVLELTEGPDVGRTVVTDNFFTSITLLCELRNRNLGLIGTVRKNRHELPEEFTSKKVNQGRHYLASMKMQLWCHTRLRKIKTLS